MRKKTSKPRLGAMPHKKLLATNKRNTGHVIVLAAKNTAQPRAQGKHNSVCHQITGKHPGAFVVTYGQTAGNMRKRDVGDAGIQQLHEGGKRNGDGNKPGIDRRFGGRLYC